MSVEKNFDEIRKKLPAHVKILGVTKRQRVPRIEEGVRAGITILGNNYVNDGQELKDNLKAQPKEWHFIGHIQSRKAKDLIHYDCVQSLDRLKVAEKLEAALESADKTLSVLVEVNIGNEPTKSGVLPEELPHFLKALENFPHLKVSGLMTMPPPLDPIEDRRPFFQQAKELFDRFQPIYNMETLSMGTSHDYEVAVEEGANLIRLGSCLFGLRDN